MRAVRGLVAAVTLLAAGLVPPAPAVAQDCVPLASLGTAATYLPGQWEIQLDRADDPVRLEARFAGADRPENVQLCRAGGAWFLRPMRRESEGK